MNLTIQILNDNDTISIDYELHSDKLHIDHIYAALSTTLDAGEFTPRYFDQGAFVIDFESDDGVKIKLVGSYAIV